MNTIMLLLLCTRVDLFFMKDSPDLIMRIAPSTRCETIQLIYSFKGNQWDTLNLTADNNIFETRIKTPDEIKLLGAYFIYPDGVIDDNKGAFYMYEVSTFPRMILPFSLSQLEVMVEQAQNKIVKQVHVDEGVMLLNYADELLEELPYIENTTYELNKNKIKSDIQGIRQILK